MPDSDKASSPSGSTTPPATGPQRTVPSASSSRYVPYSRVASPGGGGHIWGNSSWARSVLAVAERRLASVEVPSEDPTPRLVWSEWLEVSEDVVALDAEEETVAMEDEIARKRAAQVWQNEWDGMERAIRSGAWEEGLGTGAGDVLSVPQQTETRQAQGSRARGSVDQPTVALSEIEQPRISLPADSRHDAVLHSLGHLCGVNIAIETMPLASFRIFCNLAEVVQLPLPALPQTLPTLADYSRIVQSPEFSAIISSSLSIILEPFDDVKDIRYKRNEPPHLYDLRQAHPPETLLILLQTGDALVLDKIIGQLTDLSKTYANSARGVVCKLLLTTGRTTLKMLLGNTAGERVERLRMWRVWVDRQMLRMRQYGGMGALAGIDGPMIGDMLRLSEDTILGAWPRAVVRLRKPVQTNKKTP